MDDSSQHSVSSDSSDSKKSLHSSEYSSNGSSHEQVTAGLRHGVKEKRIVLASKLVVFLIIFAAAAVLSTLTFIFVEQSEERELLDAFHSHSEKLFFTITDDMLRKVEAGQSFATQMSLYEISTSATWPNVTVPHFEVIGKRMNDLAKSEMTMMMPLITADKEDEWIEYSIENQGWIEHGLSVETSAEDSHGEHHHEEDHHDEQIDEDGVHRRARMMQDLDHHPDDEHADTSHHDPGKIHTSIWAPSNSSFEKSHIVVPLWQMSPTPRNASVVNADLHQLIGDVIDLCLLHEHAFVALGSPLESIIELSGVPLTADLHEPRQMFVNPIFLDIDINQGLDDEVEHSHEHKDQDEVLDEIAGFLITVQPWRTFLINKLPRDVTGLDIHIQSNCGDRFAYRLNGREAEFLGYGAMEDANGRKYKATYNMTEGIAETNPGKGKIFFRCQYTISTVPSESFVTHFYSDKNPWRLTIMVASSFVFTAIAFLIYDWFVTRQKHKLESKAKQTGAIIDSLFPKEVQERMIRDRDANMRAFNSKQTGAGNSTSEGSKEMIADFFPSATILFGDIVGFTAWSSAREPTQVFNLLESVFSTFDEIAQKRKIFKVETVGDCYVAASGIPTQRSDHAVAMARFARDCQHAFIALTRELEVKLGPDTADLGMRFGIHTGPITAGVLRGDRARFQLFGDTMNTTARIESNGAKNKIHVSQETANEITKAGKLHWLTQRKEKIVAKGKGELTTYWLELKGDNARSSSSATVSEPCSTEGENNAKQERIPTADQDKRSRLVNWNSDILCRQLGEVIERRKTRKVKPATEQELRELESKSTQGATLVLDEVKEIVALTRCDGNGNTNTNSDTAFTSNGQSAQPSNEAALWSKEPLDEQVATEVHQYVETIAAMYHDNPFHNFEHASHVTMSVTKLLSRIVAPSTCFTKNNSDSGSDDQGHDNTYGITSDPIVQFAVTLSALIHDADHPGVPNSQLVKEGSSLAAVYGNRSIAEQNSVDLAWELLMDEQFIHLRRAIYVTSEEFHRFRQLVVNVVMATDIMDKDLKDLRNARWEKAFSSEANGQDTTEARNRKATIVMEHLIQASDVSHTMQHWHIYRKWNQRLFEELYKAYCEGRSASNPVDFWYEGEIGFFDFYIIPLTKKLSDCGVFGVSSDEYLNYALQNRREWEARGKELISEYTNAVRSTYHPAL